MVEQKYASYLEDRRYEKKEAAFFSLLLKIQEISYQHGLRLTKSLRATVKDCIWRAYRSNPCMQTTPLNFPISAVFALGMLEGMHLPICFPIVPFIEI